ncbi:uncharacterized protein LOC124688357 isoform X2 [Lolium rigidum]|uniref:uncharacterized protein LOC124688357 isoform X2 n=1 Tax=Lolium rigidum TaxID=89674 RepID=UPI001F5D67DC|nr:uncharacterized protein LOC124688357 isoform X2 [Lolium rigidum]
MATKLKDVFGQILGKRGEAVRELNVSMRAKGNMTQRQDTMLRACSIFTNMSYTVATSLVGFTTSFAAAHVHKIVGGQPVPRLLRLGVSAGAGLIAGQMVYYRSLHTCTLYLLNKGDERLKTELSTMCEYLLSIVMRNHRLKQYGGIFMPRSSTLISIN